MLLTGTYQRSLDEKLRFAMPKRVRETLLKADETVVFLTPGTDNSLAIYPASVFDRLGEQLSREAPAGQDVRTFSRLFYAQAECLDIDRQGRVRIPATLAGLANLQKEIVLIGVRDHLEIWDRVIWEDYLAGRQPRYDEIAERALGGERQVPDRSATQDADRPAQPR